MSLHYTLMKTHALLRRDIMARAREELHLTSGQPKVLEALIHHEGQDQKTLASICEIEPATLGSILLGMEKAGLIERRKKPGNRRSLYAYLTEGGKQKALKMMEIFEEEDKKALASLSEAERQALKTALEKIYRHMKEDKTERE
ncbi:MAG: MarR family winged helix-turn-helix transcriptional regulator [Pseudoramibacter sp.]